MKNFSGKTIMELITMNESKALAVIPLASDKSMQLQYINWRQLVRFGVILEDLDTFAGMFFANFHPNSSISSIVGIGFVTILNICYNKIMSAQRFHHVLLLNNRQNW